jgi:uncharacterized membrane protein YkvA (DUF1232 family)
LVPLSAVRAYLVAQAEVVAPEDIRTLLTQVDAIRRKAKLDMVQHPRFHRQVDVALELLVDHTAGECPQIPLYTVSLLAAALFYFIEPMDLIPDFIPRIGLTDDALMLELACQLGAAGLERYCTFKSIATDGVFTMPGTPARRRS